MAARAATWAESRQLVPALDQAAGVAQHPSVATRVGRGRRRQHEVRGLVESTLFESLRGGVASGGGLEEAVRRPVAAGVEEAEEVVVDLPQRREQRGLEGDLHAVDLPERGRAAAAEGADRLEQPVAVDPAVGHHRNDEGLGHQRVEALQRGELVEPEEPGGRLEGHRSGAHRQGAQRSLLVEVEQVVGPGDRRLERPLARIGPTRADQDPEAVVEVGQDLAGTHRPGAGRGQLDGERHPVEALHDLGHRLEIGVAEVHGAVGVEGPLDEQARRRRPRPVGAETRQHDHVLTRHAEDLPRRGQHVDPGRSREHGLDHLGHRVDDVFAVVHHQQRLTFCQLGHQVLGGGGPGRGRSTDAVDERGRDTPVVRQPGEVHEEDPGREPPDRPAGRLDRGAGLSHSPRADDGDQPVVGDRGVDPVDVGVPPDQRRPLRRQRRQLPPDRPQRRELGRQPVCDHLVEAPLAVDVAQAVGSEVDDLLGGQQRGHRFGHDDLPAVRHRHDARGLVQRRSVPAAAPALRGPEVDAQPNPEAAGDRPLLPRQRALHGDGGSDRLLGARERHAERVTRGRVLDAAVIGGHGPDQLVVAGEIRLHRLRVLFPQTGRADQVREEEHPRGALAHGGSLDGLGRPPGCITRAIHPFTRANGLTAAAVRTFQRTAVR